MRLVRLEVDPMEVGALGAVADADALETALRELRRRGYTRLDAYTPFEVPGLDETLRIRRTRIPIVTLIAGLTGAATGYLVQWYCNTVDFPINVGGRPMHPALAYVPIAFETAVLFAGIATFVAVFAGSRLPELWNPLFEVDAFADVSTDGYWIGVDRRDPCFDTGTTAGDLAACGASRVVRLSEGER